MKERYDRINLSKLPESYQVEFKAIKEDSENFDPELVDIFEENFTTMYGLVEKKYPEAIDKEDMARDGHDYESVIKEQLEEYEKDQKELLMYRSLDIDDPEMLDLLITLEYNECLRQEMIMQYDVMDFGEDLLVQIERTSNQIQRLHSWGHPVSIIKSWNAFYKKATGKDYVLGE